MGNLLSLAEAGMTVLLGAGSVWFSRRAAKLSEPTANGFTGHVLTSLDSITRRLDSMECRFDRLDAASERLPGPVGEQSPGS